MLELILDLGKPSKNSTLYHPLMKQQLRATSNSAKNFLQTLVLLQVYKKINFTSSPKAIIQ